MEKTIVFPDRKPKIENKYGGIYLFLTIPGLAQRNLMLIAYLTDITQS